VADKKKNLRTIDCPKCGKPSVKNKRICPSCGTSFGNSNGHPRPKRVNGNGRKT